MLERLNTPAKRIGLLPLAVVILMLVVAFIPFLEVTSYGASPLGAFIERLGQGPFEAWHKWGRVARSGAAVLGWFGLALAFGGALVAFGSDVLISPLVRWFMTGKLRRPD